ncbi:MAG: HAMP domain-containing protein [Ottowia sp.]|nr:HAMP domain-containing protein [Ottowia sp.]MBQ9579105.1 HAMP domain-containing protein [Ottowia sp.]
MSSASGQNTRPAFGATDSNEPLTIVEPLPGEAGKGARPPAPRGSGIRLFWRTFLLLGALLLGGALGSYQVLSVLEFRPSISEGAQQIASLVNLTRTALLYSDTIGRVSLIKAIDEQERVRILLYEPSDRYELFNTTRLERSLSHELHAKLGEGTIVARSVNGRAGLWVSFDIGGDGYWLLMDSSRAGFTVRARTWLAWLLVLGIFTIAGAALLTYFINQPLQRLSAAFARVRAGNYDAKLSEQVYTVEMRDVSADFNRMVEQLSRLEQDRAQMLAGISHDLRTPLARLRLDVEMSVPDDEAREQMSADIEQVDAIIGKFLDYARPGGVVLHALQLSHLVRTYAAPFMVREDMQIRINVDPTLYIFCDEVEFSRVLANLLENARRYGKAPGEDLARVRIIATASEGWVALRVQDQGQGVPDELLSQIMRPFFRADSARTAAQGTGLGLSIVARSVENMDGHLEVTNAPSGGLMVIVQLRQANPPVPSTLPQTLR